MNMGHLCPECSAPIRWALTYCAQCSWRGKPRGNPSWQAFLEGDLRDRKSKKGGPENARW